MAERGVAGGRRGSQGTTAKSPVFTGRGSQGAQGSQDLSKGKEGGSTDATEAPLAEDCRCGTIDPRCGPKGARVGDVVIAERSRWEVIALDPAHREAVCRLIAGSHALRRFRARRIEGIERAPRRRRARTAEAAPA